MPDPFVSLPPSSLHPAAPAGFLVDANGNLFYDGVTPIPNASRIMLNRLRALQFAAHRRAFDVNGPIGSHIDGWNRYGMHRDKSINITVGSSWKILSATGTTLEIEKLDGDARKVLETFWWGRDESELFWVPGFQEHGSISPGNMVVFDYPSGAHFQLVGRVEQILEGNGTSYKLRLDKAADIAEEILLLRPDEEVMPEYLTCTIYTYGMREGEKWDWILNPFYFFGTQVTKTIPTSELPVNGIWRLEETAVASPASYDEMDDPNFKLEGYGESGWVTINEPHRLHTHHDLGTDVMLKDLRPPNSARPDNFADISVMYTQFRVTYWKEAAGAEFGCQLRGFYCFNTREDLSKSIGNVETDNGRVIEGGRHFYCDARVRDNHDTKIDDYDRFNKAPGSDGLTDRVETIDVFATGKAAYRPKCLQYGYCNFMEEVYAKGLSHPEAPFTPDHKATRVLLGVLGAADIRLQQPYVLSHSFDAIRVGHPSFLYLNGYYGPLKTADGWHPRTGEWRGYGSWAEPMTITDEVTGNQYLYPKWGFEHTFNIASLPDFELDLQAFFPSLGTQYTQKRDPLNSSGTVISDMLEILGVEVERDSGTLYGRGPNRNTQALGEHTIYLNNIPINSETTYETWEASYIKPVGQSAVFSIKPLRQPAKTEESLGSRTIRTQSWDAGRGAWKFQFWNTVKTFSRLDLGDLATIGDSYDKLYTVACGGGPVIRPYEGQAINSIYTEVNRTGSRLAGLSPGDVMRVDGHSFVVIDMEPHGGDPAGSWGNKQLIARGWTSGFWAPFSFDPVHDSSNDANRERVPIKVLSILNTTDNTPMFPRDEENKPKPTDDEPLLANEYWFDGRERVYFSSANHSKNFSITWEDAKEVVQPPSNFTVQAYITLAMEMDYSEYSGADTKVVYVDGASMTTIVSGDPDPGEVRIENVGGKVSATFNIDNAGNNVELRIVLTFNIEAAAPEDDWSHDGKFLNYAQNQDVCWCLDDSGHLDTHSVVDMEPEFFRSAAVFVPGSGVLEYKVGSTYTPVSTSAIEKSGGDGWVKISHAWLASLGASHIDLRLRDVKLFDHRGTIPGSLLNKLEYMASNMVWCSTNFGGGLGAFGFHASVYRTNKPDGTSDDPVYEFYPFPLGGGNYIGGGQGAPGYEPHNASDDGASINIGGIGLGMPPLFKNLPDDCTIEEGYMTIQVTDSLRTTYSGEWEKWPPDSGNIGWRPGGPSTTTPELPPNFALLAGSGPLDDIGWGVVGGFPGASSSGNQVVVPCTELLELLYNNRHSAIHSYCLVPTTVGVDGGDLTGLLDQLMGPPPDRLPELDVDGNGSITPNDAVGVGPGEENVIAGWSGGSIVYGTISVGGIFVRITYPEGYLESGFVQPALPPMIPGP